MKLPFARLLRALKSPSGRGVAATAVVTYAGMGLSLLSAPILAQAIGADGRGVVAGSFALIQTLSWVGFFSLPRVLGRDSASGLSLSRAGLVWLTVLGAANTIAVLLLADVLSNGDDRIALGMRVAAIVLLFNGVGQVGVEQSLAKGRIGLFNLSRLGYTVLPSLTIVALAVTGNLNTTSAYLATLSGQLVTTVVGVALSVALTPRLSRAVTPWREALHLWSANAMDSVSGQLGQVLLAALSTASQVGVFSIAVMLGSAAGALAQALTQVGYAKFLRHAGDGSTSSPGMLRGLSLLGISSTIVVGSALTVFVYLYGTLLFGDTFAGLALVTAAALVSQVFTDQWNLRVLHDVAHRNVAQLVAASGTGAVVTAGSSIILGLSNSLNATSMAIALAAGAATKIAVRILLHRFRSRRTAEP
ncbi:oligosaccharide flippase family protein [Microbacterium sp. Gd 4-13]|uniref:oligosaccharide flippase family protein n=1 Tax=Microbacterium sp. Gd 4-13 TaxID=2173179 RepID=UPI0010581D9B|nr:oligosaccharide flippase family protein [Microbacterium sp. Gd 4-13]